MNKKIRWGVLSTAKIGTEKVIPALQKCTHGVVDAIASRNSEKASASAASLGIAKAYASYAELLADPDIDAIYNPLPNHLHVPWTIKALEAGKHVLCEKPIGLSATEARELQTAAAKVPELQVMEAFMYRFHPQWIQARDWVADNAIGELRTIQTLFTYFNDEPDNIRNNADIGGGGLMDIGCYPISQARFLFGREPARVFAALDYDPRFNVDRVASGILDFNGPTATFTCSTQMHPYQRTQVLGTTGRIEIVVPVNQSPQEQAMITLEQGEDQQTLSLPVCDQYTLQGDAMAQAILGNTPLPVSMSDAIDNMRVIDAVGKSHHSGAWEIL